MESKTRIKIKHDEKHSLHTFGYSSKLKAADRREKLGKAVKKKGYLPIMRRVNAIAIVNRNRNPTASKKFRADVEWLKKKFRKKRNSTRMKKEK